MNSVKTILLIGMTLCLSSCVSKKQFLALEEKVEKLSSDRPVFDLNDEDGDGVLDYLDQEPNSPPAIL